MYPKESIYIHYYYNHSVQSIFDVQPSNQPLSRNPDLLYGPFFAWKPVDAVGNTPPVLEEIILRVPGGKTPRGPVGTTPPVPEGITPAVPDEKATPVPEGKTPPNPEEDTPLGIVLVQLLPNTNQLASNSGLLKSTPTLVTLNPFLKLAEYGKLGGMMKFGGCV